MRIMIVLPRQERATGNEVTAERHRVGLVALGHQIVVERVALDDHLRLRSAVQSFTPDVVHLLHAYRSGRPWLEAGVGRVPCVVTLTGTDINDGIFTPEQGPVIQRILALAGKIITQNYLTAARLSHEFPQVADKVTYLPPGVILGVAPSPLTRSKVVPPGFPLFLHPAGIRPVKGNRGLLDLFAPLSAEGLRFSLIFCGPVLDPDYGAEFISALDSRPWARYLGVVPPEAMPATLRQADVILNNSENEGIPNALVEAAVLGVPILARAIPGNMVVVTEGVNGLLYHDPCSFADQAGALIEDQTLRQRLSFPDPDRYSPGLETERLATLYAQVVNAGRRMNHG